METHNEDPIDQPESDPWDKMTEQASSLGRKLREAFERSVAEGPNQDEVKAALRTLGNAAEKLVQAVGAAARDEEVRSSMKGAATGFFEAVGDAFSELGSDLRRAGGSGTLDEDEVVDLDPGSASTVDDPWGDDPSTRRDEDTP